MTPTLRFEKYEISSIACRYKYPLGLAPQTCETFLTFVVRWLQYKP